MDMSATEIENLLPSLDKNASLERRNCAEIKLPLKTVTPILGGGVKTREVDVIDVLRPSAIRGNLRFWWRALVGDHYNDAKKLFAAEAELWGKASDDKVGGRSKVGIVLEVEDVERVRNSVIRDAAHYRDDDFYATWTTRAQDGVKAAERCPKGVRFKLTVTVPKDQEGLLKRALRAWILFGGIGGRTRRGLGSFTCVDDEWLPDLSNMSNGSDRARELNRLLGDTYFGANDVTTRPLPLLAGASLIVAGSGTESGRLLAFPNAADAWHTALHWLKDFRQAVDPTPSGSKPYYAREPMHTTPRNPGLHPGRSRWPESDKLRHSVPSKYVDGHPTRHNAEPAWPRAGFGLPINGQFFGLGDQGKFEINWGIPNNNNGFDARDRMASPLIVKSLPVKGGGFFACALWLNRAYPPGAVGLVQTNNGRRTLLSRSNAPFGQLIASGDTSLLSAIQPTTACLRDAFLDWVGKQPNVRRIA
jgi:CRISPR-associated protein Cmr1